MATYATYHHVELDRVGLGKRRVLKPPGGGSSISFGEDEDNRPKNLAQQQAPQEKSLKAETNGTATPESVNDAAATKENNPSAATNGSVTNGSPVGSNSGRSSECATTPTSAKKLDTQNRLFGEDPVMDTPTRKVRDHQRSTIFSDGPGTKPNGSSNGPRAAYNEIGLPCSTMHAISVLSDVDASGSSYWGGCPVLGHPRSPLCS